MLGCQGLARRAFAGRQQRHDVRGNRDRRPRVDRLGLVQHGGDFDGGVQVHRGEHQGTAVGRAQREPLVVRPFELPLADVPGRDAQPQQRAPHGGVEAGGQRTAGDHLRGGAGGAVVDHGRLQRAGDAGGREQRGVRHLRRHVPAPVRGQRGQRHARGERRFACQLPGRGGAGLLEQVQQAAVAGRGPGDRRTFGRGQRGLRWAGLHGVDVGDEPPRIARRFREVEGGRAIAVVPARQQAQPGCAGDLQGCAVRDVGGAGETREVRRLVADGGRLGHRGAIGLPRLARLGGGHGWCGLAASSASARGR